ncbi:MAG: GMC family oxidoreductase [Gammaproteobacteria bacterium]|nr:GMC family oxidoreductase [Gammaproteobacteria bacterium]
MSEQNYDVIIIGSGAGGGAAGYSLVTAGQRVLMLEKGGYLPDDGSTLDVTQVFQQGRFKSQQKWLDNHNRSLTPEEYYNVGGKTRWYGAALLRFSPQEFQPDEAFACPGWPIDYIKLEPYYVLAEQLLKINHFDNETGLQQLIDRIIAADPAWRVEALPLGLKKDILQDSQEARHFDGFASPGAYKSDAQSSLLAPIQKNPLFTLLTNKEVTGLLYDENKPTDITGVTCTEGCSYRANRVILAAGAMTSPRLLQDYLAQSGLNKQLPFTSLVGANFKLHLNSALLAFSPFTNHDVLRKTAIFFNQAFPHSTVQCLGWLDGDMLATQLPAALPKFVANLMGTRVRGFFVTTEDGSSTENRITAGNESDSRPVLDYDLARLPASNREHDAMIRAFRARLLRCGLISVSKPMGLTGTAHALGSLLMGKNPATSVVDANGKVHGIDNLYVADGSVLPRASRVNPALTIYAWALRLGKYLADNPVPADKI